MRDFKRLVVSLILIALSIGGCASDSAETLPVIHFVSDLPSYETQQRSAQACTNKANGRYRIEVTQGLLWTESDYERIARRLAASDRDLDVFMADAVWTEQFVSDGWLRELPADFAATVRSETIPSLIDGATVNETLYAAPFSAESAAVVYRTSLGDSPETWADVTRLNETVPEGSPIQFGLSAEDRTGAVALLASLAASAGEPISPHMTSSNSLDTAGAILQDYTSNAAVFAGEPTAVNPTLTAGEFGQLVRPSRYEPTDAKPTDAKWAPWPGTGASNPSKVGIHQMNLAVSHASKHPDLAFEAAQCLRDTQQQKANALSRPMFPTISSLYDDPDIRARYEELADIQYKQLSNGVQLPKTSQYQAVSIALDRAVRPLSSIEANGFGARVRGLIQEAEQHRV